MESTSVLRLWYAVIVIAIVSWLCFILQRAVRASSEKSIPNVHLFRFLLLLIKLYNLKTVPMECWLFMLVNAACHFFAKEGLFMLKIPIRRLLVVFRADFVEAICKHPNSQEKALEYDIAACLTGPSVLFVNTKTAQKRRKIMGPFFHHRAFLDYMEVFNEKSMKLVNEFKEQPDQWIDIQHGINQLTLGIICRTALGVQLDANKETQEFFKNFDKGKDIWFKTMINPWAHNEFFYRVLPSTRKLKKCQAAILQFTENIVSEYKKDFQAETGNHPLEKAKAYSTSDMEGSTHCKKHSFVELLLEAHLKDPADFTLSDVQSEVLTFILEAMDTLAIAISLALMSLGLEKTVQERAIQEIDSIFQDDPHRLVTHDDLKNMKYLECIIKETLRLYPSAPYLGKELKTETVIGAHKIPANTGALFNLYMLHRDPDQFPNPEKFDPDRFLPENSTERHPYAYIPFSVGSRNCIGQKFAMAEMKCVLANILRNLKITSRDHRDKLHLSWGITIAPVDSVFVKFTPRENTLLK